MADEMITSDDVLGKDAVDPDGEIIGVIMKLHIRKHEKTLVGLTVDQGFMKPDLFIGIDCVKRFGVDTVFLSRIPYDKYKGTKVLSSDGAPVGYVREIRLKRHHPESIVLDLAQGMIRKQECIIPASDIQEMGERIILRKKKRDFD